MQEPGYALQKEHPLHPAESAAEYESRSLQDPGLRQYIETTHQQPLEIWPRPSWNLEHLTLAAFYFHPDLEVARAQWVRASGGVDTAKARPNPFLQATPRYSTNPSFGTSPWYMGLFSGFVIETAGKRRHRMDQAQHLSEASRHNIGKTAWLVRSRLRLALIGYLALQERKTLIQRQVEAQSDILAGLQRRLDVGESSQVEVTQTQVALSQLQIQQQEIEKQTAEALGLLAQAIGVPIEALSDVTFSSDWYDKPTSLAGVSRKNLRGEALQGREDILSLLEEYEASQSALRLALSKRYPDIRLGPGYLWDQGESFWTIPLDLIFASYYGTKGLAVEEDARRQEVRERFLALQAQIIGDVDRAYLGYEEALEKLRLTEGLIAEQQHQVQMVEEQLNAGESDRLALRLVQIQLETVLLGQVDALEQAQRAANLLEDAIQRPLTEERLLLNKFETSLHSEQGQ